MGGALNVLAAYGTATGGGGGGYAQTYSIAIDHTQCGSSDSTNFPDYVFMSNANLKTVANGGLIQHTTTVNGQTVPTDLVFSSDSGATSLYSWEIEYYDGTNGIIYAHVKIPTVSHTSDTIYYVNYGNASISTYQGGAVGAAWNSNYKIVSHYANGTTLSLLDSTNNSNNGTNNSASATTGKVDGGVNTISASSQYVNYSTSNSIFNSATKLTMSGWMKKTTSTSLANITCRNSGVDGAFLGWFDSSGTVFVVARNSSGTFGNVSLTADTNWHLYHMVFNGTLSGNSNILKLYIDGVLQTLSFNGSVSTSIVTSATMNVGNDSPAGGGFSDASFDEARTSTIDTSADWILTEYNNQDSPGNIGSPGFHTFT